MAFDWEIEAKEETLIKIEKRCGGIGHYLDIIGIKRNIVLSYHPNTYYGYYYGEMNYHRVDCMEGPTRSAQLKKLFHRVVYELIKK